METTDEFAEEMGEGIEDRMTTEGEVSSVTVTTSCSTSENAAFGSASTATDSALPFSSWNLNTYSFSDWFVLLFVLCAGCSFCFGAGFMMHRRRVMKALEDAAISSFGAQQDDVAMVPTTYGRNPKVDVNAPIYETHETDDRFGGGDAVATPAAAEIEIGVSVHQNKMGMLRDYD